MPKKMVSKDLFKKIVEQEKEALDFGFYWENIDQLVEQIKSECEEIKEAALNQDNLHLKEEVGDLINATISLCIFFNLDPFETLKDNVEKFQKRYDVMVSLVKKDGLQDLKNKPMEVLLTYWHKAKEAVLAYN